MRFLLSFVLACTLVGNVWSQPRVNINNRIIVQPVYPRAVYPAYPYPVYQANPYYNPVYSPFYNQLYLQNQLYFQNLNNNNYNNYQFQQYLQWRMLNYGY